MVAGELALVRLLLAAGASVRPQEVGARRAYNVPRAFMHVLIERITAKH
jgi:hypothetical protein